MPSNDIKNYFWLARNYVGQSKIVTKLCYFRIEELEEAFPFFYALLIKQCSIVVWYFIILQLQRAICYVCMIVKSKKTDECFSNNFRCKCCTSYRWKGKMNIHRIVYNRFLSGFQLYFLQINAPRWVIHSEFSISRRSFTLPLEDLRNLLEV